MKRLRSKWTQLNPSHCFGCDYEFRAILDLLQCCYKTQKSGHDYCGCSGYSGSITPPAAPMHYFISHKCPVLIRTQSRSQLRSAGKEFLARPKVFRAKDLKLSTTGARVLLRTAIPISDIGIRPKILQATTEATLCLTTDNGAMVIPMPEATSEISIGTSTAVWETLGAILASRNIPYIKSWNPGA
jgi:hypothetical protein